MKNDLNKVIIVYLFNMEFGGMDLILLFWKIKGRYFQYILHLKFWAKKFFVTAYVIWIHMQANLLINDISTDNISVSYPV